MRFVVGQCAFVKQSIVTVSAGASTATAGPGKKIFAGPIWGENFLNFFFKNDAIWRTLYFWATAGPLNVAGPVVTYPLYPPLSTDLRVRDNAVEFSVDHQSMSVEVSRLGAGVSVQSLSVGLAPADLCSPAGLAVPGGSTAQSPGHPAFSCLDAAVAAGVGSDCCETAAAPGGLTVQPLLLLLRETRLPQAADTLHTRIRLSLLSGLVV